MKMLLDMMHMYEDLCETLRDMPVCRYLTPWGENRLSNVYFPVEFSMKVVGTNGICSNIML